MKLQAKSKSIKLFMFKQRKVLILLLVNLLYVRAANAQISSTICKAYNSIVNNQLISALAFVALAILLFAMLWGENKGEKSALIRFLVVIAALLNLPTIGGWLGLTPC